MLPATLKPALRDQLRRARAVHKQDLAEGWGRVVLPDRTRRFVFAYRKSGGDLLAGRGRDAVFLAIRPDGNRLDGYAPSSAADRVRDESG